MPLRNPGAGRPAKDAELNNPDAWVFAWRRGHSGGKTSVRGISKPGQLGIMPTVRFNHDPRGRIYMRKLTLLLAVLALAATSSVADAAKKKAKQAAAAPPAAAAQEAPGAPGVRVLAGYFREVGKIGQPVAPPAPAKKGKKK